MIFYHIITHLFLSHYMCYALPCNLGDCSMTIDKLTLEDEGTWQCQVTSVTREKPLQSDKIFLQVLVQPGRPSIKQTVSVDTFYLHVGSFFLSTHDECVNVTILFLTHPLLNEQWASQRHFGRER